MRMSSPPSGPHRPHQEGKRAVGAAAFGPRWALLAQSPQRSGLKSLSPFPEDSLRSKRQVNTHAAAEEKLRLSLHPLKWHKNPGGYETGKTPHAHPESSLRGWARAVRGALLCTPRTAGLP